MKNAFCFSAILLLLVGACKNDNEDDLNDDDNGNNNQQPTCETEDMTYSSGIATIFDNNCALSGCHDGNSGQPGFTTYEEVKVYADNGRISARALEQQDMPPTGPLEDCDQQKLAAWIDSGAPEN